MTQPNIFEQIGRAVVEALNLSDRNGTIDVYIYNGELRVEGGGVFGLDDKTFLISDIAIALLEDSNEPS